MITATIYAKLSKTSGIQTQTMQSTRKINCFKSSPLLAELSHCRDTFPTATASSDITQAQCPPVRSQHLPTTPYTHTQTTYHWLARAVSCSNQPINQSTFVKRHKSRANRRRVKKKARPSGYRMLWQKVPSLKHVWKSSQFWLIDNYMAASSTLKASWDWKILPTSQKTFE